MNNKNLIKSFLIAFVLFQNAFSAELISVDNPSLKVTFEKFPLMYKLESMVLESTDASEVNLNNQDILVRLYSPVLNHFSSDPVISSLENEQGIKVANKLKLTNVFFIYPGIWELHIITKKGTSRFEFDILEQNRNLNAKTHSVIPGTTYIGNEYHNDKPTGQTCYVIVDNISVNNKGLHCYDIEWRYASNRTDVVKDGLITSSRITNYHRREYPSKKTCAKNIDGTTSGNEIYSKDSDVLINDIFNGMIKHNKTEFHIFLSLNREKILSRARIHGLMWNKEWDVDCLNLKLVK